jgi:hypothetical protein
MPLLTSAYMRGANFLAVLSLSNNTLMCLLEGVASLGFLGAKVAVAIGL